MKGGIFYVEDSAVDVHLMLSACNKLNYKPNFSFATDGEQAIILLEAIAEGKIEPPALALLDLHLPKRNGFEVFEILRKNKKMAKVPVVLLTTSNNPREKERCEELGGIFLNKPFDFSKYTEIVSILKKLCPHL